MRTCLIFLGLALLLTCSACKVGEDIVIPESDSTPPTITLTVWLDSEPIVLTSEGRDIYRDVYSGTLLSFLADGRDPDGGVKAACIIACTEANCCIEVIREGKTMTLCSQQSCLLPAFCPGAVDQKPGEMARTAKLDGKSMKFNDGAKQCKDGWHLSSLSGQVYAIAENFHGGIAQTRTFAFKYEP